MWGAGRSPFCVCVNLRLVVSVSSKKRSFVMDFLGFKSTECVNFVIE